MLTLTEYIPEDTGYLVVIGDVHLGDELFTERSEKKLRGYIDWVQENPNARVFLNGDIFNVATRVSKTSPFDANKRFSDEMDMAIDLFKPIANQIIGATDGNHENRLIDFANHSLINTLCQILSTPERKVMYCGISCLLFVKQGTADMNYKTNKRRRASKCSSAQTYSGFIHHTTGGGGTIGGKLNRVDKLRQIVAGCDFYCGSHNHLEGTVKTKIFLPNPNNCTLTEVRQVLVDCGGFLDYGGYVERGQCPPVDLGAPRIRLDACKKDIHIAL